MFLKRCLSSLYFHWKAILVWSFMQSHSIPSWNEKFYHLAPFVSYCDKYSLYTMKQQVSIGTGLVKFPFSRIQRVSNICKQVNLWKYIYAIFSHNFTKIPASYVILFFHYIDGQNTMNSLTMMILAVIKVTKTWNITPTMITTTIIPLVSGSILGKKSVVLEKIICRHLLR